MVILLTGTNLLLLLAGITFSSAFVAVQPRRIRYGSIPLSMSDDGSIDGMRKLLEGSWNSNMMGKLPTTPTNAANEAGGSLLTAKERGLDLVLINLLLPSYDVAMGSSVYDEVEAVSFCVALSQFLEGKASIVVRDNKTVNTVSRVLAAREKETAAEMLTLQKKREQEKLVEEEEADDDDDFEARVEGEIEDDSEEEEEEEVLDTVEDDEKSEELEDFRRQLMMDWDEEDNDVWAADQGKKEKKKGEDANSEKEAALDKESEPSSEVLAQKPKSYRLASMFGDATFKKGPDMFDKVVKAVSTNGQPQEDEDTLIVLSANSEEETIGIRALVAKYQHKKTIVLVNCQMDPIPRELVKAETIYSLLPLIARPVGAKTEAPSIAQPKVIVLRRYPRDFEVFMDFGTGFELTETVTTDQVGRTGPSMAWIVDRLKRQMDARL